MIGSTISILLALTWGGLQFPWTSGHVLAPLIIGAVGIMIFFVLEMFWLKGPTVSFEPSLCASRPKPEHRFPASSSQTVLRSAGKQMPTTRPTCAYAVLCRYLGTIFHGVGFMAVVCGCSRYTWGTVSLTQS